MLIVPAGVTYAALFCLTQTSYHVLAESAADRDLQKVLQQLELHISFLEELTKMGGAMRTVLTKILTNQQTFKELSMGEYVWTVSVLTVVEQFKLLS